MAGGSTNLKHWPKGVSGNPGGKPKGLEKVARERIAATGVVECIDFLFATMRDSEADQKVRVQAAGMLLDRALGKPRESVDVTAPNLHRIDWSMVDDATGSELERALTKILAGPDVAALPDAG